MRCACRAQHLPRGGRRRRMTCCSPPPDASHIAKHRQLFMLGMAKVHFETRLCRAAPRDPMVKRGLFRDAALSIHSFTVLLAGWKHSLGWPAHPGDVHTLASTQPTCSAPTTDSSCARPQPQQPPPSPPVSRFWHLLGKQEEHGSTRFRRLVGLSSTHR